MSTRAVRLLSCLSLLFAVCFLSFSAAQVIEEEALTHDNVGSRRLLQATISCPVSFETQNYTIITSQCKGPNYTAARCCSAFKEFACPFAEYINNASTDCATTMFSYINLHGKYPPGLFANFCREGKEGLACDVEAPSPSVNSSPMTHMLRRKILILTHVWLLECCILCFLCHDNCDLISFKS